jgi:hypothetical protein
VKQTVESTGVIFIGVLVFVSWREQLSRLANCPAGTLPGTYQSVVHAGGSLLVLALRTIIITITEQSVFDAPVSAELVGCWTGEPFEALVGIVAVCRSWFGLVRGSQVSLCLSGDQMALGGNR